MRRHYAALTYALVLTVLRPAQGQDVEGWPCRGPYQEELTAAEVWGGEPPAQPARDWREVAPVAEAVRIAADPENNPEKGAQAIATLARDAKAGTEEALALAFYGLLERSNALRSIVLTGIRDWTLRARILERVVAENDEALAELREESRGEGGDRRGEIEEARSSNLRGLDDAEDEARFLCRRLDYIGEKVRLLAAAIRAEMGND